MNFIVVKIPILAILICLAACSSFEKPDPVAADLLLSGDALFGEVVDVSDIKSNEVLAIDAKMQRYVANKVGGDPNARSRLQKLIRGMIEDDFLTLDYNPNLTYTAAETFRYRQGNCLSFSMLFATLAREADLELTFQMVEIPPSFRADGEMIFLDNHINVRVKDIRRDIQFGSDYVVDFNTAEYNGNYDTREVDDNYAIALYFSNVAVESMQMQDWKMAFRYLKKGIETDPEIAGLWVNLGVLYSRHAQYKLATDAYRQALAIHPSNKSALANIASALQQLGRDEEAQRYARKVTYYRNRHPYYHYYLAKEAYRNEQGDTAMKHLDRAIKLKGDEHQFYFLRGLVHQQLGDVERTVRDFITARELAGNARLVSGYDRKLEALKSKFR